MMNNAIRSSFVSTSSSISSTAIKKSKKVGRGDRSTSDVDSVTEKSTVASVSSDDDDDSFGPDFTLSTLGQAVVGKFKVSARGLAQQSSARLSPFLQRSNDVVAFKPRPKRVRAPLTLQQLQARKRRSEKLARIARMLQRINQDPFVASRTILALSSILLMIRAGRGHVASCLSLIGAIILHQTTKLTSTSYLRSWYYISALTVLVSVSSWIVTHTLASNYFNSKEATAADGLNREYLVWTDIMPRLWGLLLAFWLHQDVMASNDTADAHSIDTIYVKASVLGVKILHNAPGAANRRPLWKPSTIVVHHGPVLVGDAPTKTLLDDKGNECVFRTTAFSHFLESAEGSLFTIRLQHGADEFMAVATVPIPTIRNMKMSDWFPLMNSNEKLGELLVQIQSRPLAVPFLFRASTVLPIMICTGLAVFFWR